MQSILQRYVNIRREEISPILLAALYFFSILTALMLLRPARDALGMQRGIESVRWLFMGTLVVTAAANPLFGLIVSRLRRMTFIAASYAFFASNLLVFYGLLVFAPRAVGETSGMVFYVWMSVFNFFVTMIFWALMADRFTLDQSKRLFGVIAAGGTLGAVFGSWLASVLAKRTGTPSLLLIAAVLLMLAVAAAWMLVRIQPERESDKGTDVPHSDANEKTIIGGSAWEGFRATFRSPYLFGISMYVLILAVMVTFLYFTRLQMVAALGQDLDMRTGVFARLDFYVQAATLLLQLIVAGHLMKRLGVHVALALVPVIIAIGYGILAVVSSLVVLVMFEATFRAMQRAIMRPARETLFTVVSREDKYKSKGFIDTFIYRAGDVIGAQTEGLLTRIGIGLVALSSVAVPLAIAWAALGFWLGKAQHRLASNVTDPLKEDGHGK